ncbi:uncharacterized protein ACJ7VT_016618 [Polymixia lowei]
MEMGRQASDVEPVPPHLSPACSKMRPQIVKVGRQASDVEPRSLEPLDHHTSQQITGLSQGGESEEDGPDRRVQGPLTTSSLSPECLVHRDPNKGVVVKLRR